MGDLLDVLNAFSNPLKIGWVVWIAWGVGQVFWYRQERKQPASRPAAGVAARRPVAAKTVTPVPVVTRLVTPEPEAAPRPRAANPPAFDPSKAVVETFSASTTDLESFVADFERNKRRPHSAESTRPSGFGAQTH